MNVENKRTALIERMKAASSPVVQAKDPSHEPIAIIGLSGYFPQSMDVQAFWEALDQDRSLIEEIPGHRFDIQALYDAEGKDPDKFHTKWAGIIPDVRQFDPAFFGILPAEADLMDPRKRLLLMTAYHALEDAGYTPRSLSKEMTGVFVAAEEDEYRQCLLEKGVDIKTGSGSSSSLIANQLSYFFDFRGPSEFVNTMCSGAAVAIHRAVAALRSGEINYALVGAANILLHPDPFIFLSRTGQMSPHSSVLSFGKEAQGFLRADGVASILLKPLSKAIADKDAIYAVIRNTAVNYNGQGGMSMAAPNIPAHVDLIKACYTEAGIDPRQVDYIEAQGMGNPVADIAEWESFNRALTAIAKEKKLVLSPGSCRVSTLKPMIGHMHAASAMGALFKIIHSFQTNKIHRIQGFKDINPDLDITDQPCRLLTETEDWPAAAWARLAGLHAYGSGGNNAHILIEEYKGHKENNAPQEEPVVIPFSAATEEQCRTMVRNLADAIVSNPSWSLSSIAFTLQNGRDAMKHRVAFVAGIRSTFLEQARAYVEGQNLAGTWTGIATEKTNAVTAPLHDPAALAQAWVKGIVVTWEKIPFLNPVQRLHLPVYPFNCRAYWMEEDKEERTSEPVINAEEIIRQTLSYFLKTTPDQVDINEEFSAMGFDSLLVTNLSKKLKDQHGLAIEHAIFFEHNTAAKLIAFIGKHYQEQLAKENNIRKATYSKGISAKHSAQDTPATDKDLIAIIGLAGSFPQSADLEAFWKNLLAGNDCVEEIPAERWAVKEHYAPDVETADKTGKSYGKWGGFLKDLYYFDPLFFNIAPSEAAAMNPKERQFLQCAWHVIEDAGYTPQSLANEQVGVFAGVTRSGLDPYKVSMFPVANRVSYTFNFRGPSMPVDTACSSSLVAIHEACQHIHAGECTVAIAGGVHAFLGPSHFAALSGLHMLSPDGRSRSFGSEANGMVPGEGVGAVLLKPLKRALADRDHIYGVIRASATNHGGKSNGFTVPNPQAHAQLIQDTLTKAHINARDINYVEAHGTGTSLGDPIEIRGLNEAFRKDTTDTQYCSIGSVKSNIGHLEAAAGISGLTKVLLQMKMGKLVPSLHAQQLNPHINFSATPFYIQQALADWNPIDNKGNRIPRMACVSSFGAGGSNAHVVIGEAPSTNRQAFMNSKPAIIVLSAKGRDRLQEQAKQLLSFIESHQHQDHLLHDLAFTLQTGRVALEHRLAIEASSLQELKSRLSAFLAGHDPIEKTYSGRKDKCHPELVEGWLQQAHGDNQYNELLTAWVKGAPIDWNKLYEGNSEHTMPHRISLPVYPFLKEYFGLPDDGREKHRREVAEMPVLHPLVHRNESTFAAQQFTARFTGEEFFLRDHIVHGEKILPGVAYLEMVQAAAGIAAGNMADNENEWTISLQHVAWVQPVVVRDKPVQLTINLASDEAGQVSFVISSNTEKASGEEAMVHSQGTVLFTEPIQDLPALNIPALRLLTTRKKIDAGECYQLFDQLGIAYGPSHQAIEYLLTGEAQLLAKLSIPAAITDTLQQFSLHPAMMDAAFQAIMGFLLTGGNEQQAPLSLAVPFALQELTVYAPCVAAMWAHIRYHKVDENKGHVINNLSFDLDICDEAGKICVRMRGFRSREFQKQQHTASQNLLFLQPSWEERPLITTADKIAYDHHLVLYETGLVSPTTVLNNIRFVPYALSAVSTEGQLEQLTHTLFKEVQQLLRAMPAGKVIVQVLLTAGQEAGLLTAVAGLLKTAHMENPRIAGQVIIMEESAGWQEISSAIEQSSSQPQDEVIQYIQGKRMVSCLQEYTPSNNSHHPWKEGGVYLITGGAGGLGLLLAQEIVQRTKEVTLILTGRSALTVEKINHIESLRRSGANIVYSQTDITNAWQVNKLVQEIVATHGRINGVIHAAGLIRDNFLIKKTEEEIREVMAPKVQGLINLDAATQQLPMDHFILFASVAGVMGNTGQADYAVANAFMNEFANHRNQLVAAQNRYGNTTAINWPLWKEGGMQVDVSVEEMMRDTLGMNPLETGAGLTALYTMLGSGNTQMMVLAGNLPLLRNTFLKPAAHKIDIQPEPALQQVAGLPEKAIAYLKKLLSGVINLSPDRIHADTAMDEYGIDSIMVMKMTTELEKVFGSLPKTLFFEYQNISELTKYFLSSHAAKLAALLGTAPATKPTEKIIPGKDKPAPAALKRKPVPAIARTGNKPPEKQETDIAIIGVSGRYPKARNLREFWDNLRNGKNCITEIPKERWDHTPYFDEDRNKPLKTNSKWGGFLDGMEEFDPLFFNISPREAEVTDPQERLFLQCAYETLQDAGYTRQQLNNGPVQGRVGVFVGVMWTEYQLYSSQETILGRPMVLSSSSSSIANRVSYCCNFNGPSLALDTMCSSSLTAIHIACQSLRQGDCEVALAGGVNISVHPNKYLILGYGKLASSKGLCESFGSGGDGYVPSEGVGAVLLKPLSKAIADGDQIYGVIKGTAINHGGKVNGYSVPNPKAQAKAVARALAHAGFDARTVSYIEAHGTGTALGDPIEIAGLSEGFKVADKQFCAIGSVKSNIGHCESAAGIAGITKVLLQMKYRQLAPSLHSTVLNPNINFANTPFVVQQELTEWKRPVVTVDGYAREYPRRAGISSFGAGGANAHILIEEYIPGEPQGNSRQLPVAIVLSAKTAERLQESAQQLLTAIQNRYYEEKDLVNMAYTLQVGREVMEERVAIEVSSLKELEEKLAGYIAGETEQEGLYPGKARSQKEILSFFADDEDMQTTVESWLARRKYARLLRLWVNGYDIQWEKLYQGHEPLPQRISLPAYPFMRTRYWPDIVAGTPITFTPAAASSFMHPLVHRNTSTFATQRFSSTFSGQEFFLKDHVVDGKKLLPGVAYVEMIKEAMMQSGGDNSQLIQVDNMAWIQPLSVNGHPEKIDISLTPRDNDTIAFEIISQMDSGNNRPVIHSQGTARYIDQPADRFIDIPAIKQAAGSRILTARDCYALYERMGIMYGPAHRSIENIYLGDDQLLAQLSLPAAVAGTLQEYYLHPSLMDAALQAVIGFAVKQYTGAETFPLAIPFAIKSLHIYHPCTPRMYALIRRSEPAGKEQSNDQLSFDIDLCDETGKSCVQITGFTSRIVRKNGSAATDEVLLMQPHWIPKASRAAQEGIPYAQHQVLVIENDTLAASLTRRMTGSKMIPLNTTAGFEQYAVQVFEAVKQLFSARLTKKVLMQVLIPMQGDKQLLAALAGFMKTAQFENPLFTGQVIGIEEGDSEEVIIQRLQENGQSPDTLVRYQHNAREVFSLQEYSFLAKTASPIWKEGGVYLITGGAGGLGMIFAKEITSQLKQVTVILTGRSALSRAREKELAAMNTPGISVVYRQADITQETAVNDLIQQIANEYRALNGIIHSAGILRDNFIIKKSAEELQAVMAPKVKGLTNLDQATCTMPLDCFIICSSVTGVTGNAGQADYALANAYMDRYAAYRMLLVAVGQRSGKTVSVNWPLWKEGGMQVPDEQVKALRENYGLVPMETSAGLNALYQAMQAGMEQVMILQGNAAKIRTTFLTDPSNKEAQQQSPIENTTTISSGITNAANGEDILTYLKQVMSGVIKLPAGQINPDKPMEEYGIDSVMVMQMTNELEKVYGSLPKTLFFEYRNINELAEYFTATFPAKQGVAVEHNNEKKPEAVINTHSIANAQDYLKGILANAIKLPAAQINADKPMEEYGIDSVLVMQMTNELEKVFGSLSRTLFFEYQTISELTDYFQANFPDAFRAAQEAPSPVATVVTETPVAFNRATRFTPAPAKTPEKKDAPQSLDIAIVGLAGRYPQARDLQAFWKALQQGKNCITEIPEQRWDHGLYFDKEKNKLGKSYSKWGGFLEGIDEFDPLFFGISAREAEALDPQERLFLQCAYETLEDAGYTKSSVGRNKETGLAGNVGVYAGVMWDEYQLYGAQQTALGNPMAFAGIAGSIANRVSYYCNFNGMSITLNTMCSSSLTAIHLACQGIQQGECEAAIAGGVNLSLHPNKYMALGYGSFLSSKGLCESFGAGGDGYVPGEGVGAVLLKPLSKAIEDNDHIYGVIKGTAVNHGGKTNSYTVPNPNAQANVIGKAMKMAGFEPQTISYLEAHGTGTSLGDPIEITGLNKAFNTKATGFCAIGSVKSNIGHAESASGIAGLTKVLLQMKYRQLVPSLHAAELNPNIDFANSCFVVQQHLAPWKRPLLNLDGQEKEYPRRAGLSSFGAGGSNAHILLEEYIPDAAAAASREAAPSLSPQEKVFVLLSARTEDQLRRQATNLAAWIKEQPQRPAHLVQDIAYTLQVGREALRERLAIEVSSLEELNSLLEKYMRGIPAPAMYRGQVNETGEAMNGKAMEETRNKNITTWLAQRRYHDLLNYWVQGLNVDWNSLYNSQSRDSYRPYRISLPGYPFATDRYWIPKGAAPAVAMPEVKQPVAPSITPAPIAQQAETSNELLEKLVYKLKVMFAEIVQFSIIQIDHKEPLENYGIDSVMIVKLNGLLTDIYGELPATLFYEYQTLAALAVYLANKHREKSLEWTMLSTMAESTPVAAPPGKKYNKEQVTAQAAQQPVREPIAIIGISGRYPQANDVHEFWENLKEGKDCITEIPGDRWDLNNFFHADSAEAAALGKSYGKWGGFIDGFADFDPRFFNISPKEARGMDPHVRLFMESCWQVLEDGGYTRTKLMEQYKGNVGVFAGVTRAGFACYGAELMQHGQYVLNTMSAVANRVSYFLNLKGPSVPVDTMCSSSLTAIHDAVESLLKGECAMAIAGGVNLLLHPSEYVLLSANNFLSTDGRCRSFGAGGTGYVPGEGVGAVLLKPLSRAIADKDNIYAVIKGTSINHGGKTNGYTVPNPVAQGELISNALKEAHVNARGISYVEAHGTGTLLGDPIEIAGLTQAFSAHTTDTQYCAIGSSKSNIGHLEAAAGIAGITKIILQMKHGMLAPSLHAATLNPNIHFEKSPFVVQRSLSPWQRPVATINGVTTELPRIAGISSFGAGGSNAHIILEEFIPE